MIQLLQGFRNRYFIENKKQKFCRYTILSGEKNKAISARKQWMLNHIKAKGKLYLDSGAIIALVQFNKSLLPVGIVKIDGGLIGETWLFA